MIYTLPITNWAQALAAKVSECADGDTIIVPTQAAKELGKRAQARVCPTKTIHFEVVPAQPTEVVIIPRPHRLPGLGG